MRVTLRLIFSGILLGMGWNVEGLASLRLALSAERSHFLLYEAAYFTLELTNEGSRPVELSNSEDGKRMWLSFSILRPNNVRVRPDLPFEPPDRILQPGETAELSVNITPHYLVRETGEYRIQAVVRLEGEVPLMTAPLTFTVGKGERFWSVDRRMPDDSVRTFSLIRFLKEQSMSPHLYLQIEDEGNNLVFTTVDLGPIAARDVPKTMFDAEGGFHLSWSNGPKSYRYVAFAPDGRVLRRDQRLQGATFPGLRLTQTGKVEFVGGTSEQAEEGRARLSQTQSNAVWAGDEGGSGKPVQSPAPRGLPSR